MGYEAFGQIVPHALARCADQIRQAEFIHLEEPPDLSPDGARQWMSGCELPRVSSCEFSAECSR